MIPLALGVLAASLLGSVHCAGMCGGLVTLYAAGGPRSSRRAALAGHAAYNAGRLAAYATLGALAGLAGSVLDLAGSLVGVQRIAAVTAGVLVVVWGVATLLEARGIRLPGISAPRRARTEVSRALASAAAMSPPTRGLTLGLLTGLLPCGWLWAFVVTAAAGGRPLAGAAVMAAFWLGTLPVMLGLGIGARALAGLLGRHWPAVSGMVMLALGVLALVGRLHAPALSRAPHDHAARPAVGAALDDTRPPTGHARP